MKEVLQRFWTAMRNARDPAFYTTTINGLLQLLLRGLLLWKPEGNFAPLITLLADISAWFIGFGMLFGLKNAVDPGAPRTMTEVAVKTELARLKGEALKEQAYQVDRGVPVAAAVLPLPAAAPRKPPAL